MSVFKLQIFGLFCLYIKKEICLSTAGLINEKGEERNFG